MGKATIITLGISLLSLGIASSAFLGYNDVLFQPNLHLDVKLGNSDQFPEKGELSTYTKITLKNNGLAPATDVRITINPIFPILIEKKEFSTASGKFDKTGPIALAFESPRLSANDEIILTLITDSPLDKSHFDIYVSYAEGETVHNSSTIHGKKFLDLDKYYGIKN